MICMQILFWLAAVRALPVAYDDVTTVTSSDWPTTEVMVTTDGSDVIETTTGYVTTGEPSGEDALLPLASITAEIRLMAQRLDVPLGTSEIPLTTNSRSLPETVSRIDDPVTTEAEETSATQSFVAIIPIVTSDIEKEEEEEEEEAEEAEEETIAADSAVNGRNTRRYGRRLGRPLFRNSLAFARRRSAGSITPRKIVGFEPRSAPSARIKDNYYKNRLTSETDGRDGLARPGWLRNSNKAVARKPSLHFRIPSTIKWPRRTTSTTTTPSFVTSSPTTPTTTEPTTSTTPEAPTSTPTPITPEMVYVTDESQHGTPEFQHGSPEFRHGSPEFRHGSPEFQHGSPEFRHGSPEFRHGSPEFQHGSPEFRHGSPEFRHGTPEFQHGTPEVNYATTTESSPVTNFRATATKDFDDWALDDAPQQELAEEAMEEEEEEEDLEHKYLVEDRTPNGYIIGEYGVVSRSSGSLRGVRYTAHGSINPDVIKEALLTFLSL